MKATFTRHSTRWRIGAYVIAGVALVPFTLLTDHRLFATMGRLTDLPRPSIGPVLLAAVAISASYVCAAMGLRAAAGQALPFQQTVLAQLAAALANRVVPAGVGGVAVNLRYLQRSGVRTPTATVAVAAVTLCNGLASVVALLAVLPALSASRITGFLHTALLIAGPVVAVLVVVWALARHRLPARIRTWSGEFRAAVGDLRRDPRRFGVVLACSLGVKVAHIVALVAALQAFDSELSPMLVAAVYVTGSAAAAAVPTPGGLGATEAVLVAGLVAVGGSAAIVLAGVLTFRLVSFWLPMLPGAAATWVLRRRDMLG